ncbi:hypothetical protein ASF20_13295 [Methylobacterium sp. Leaf88]|nr:hypothetical protein ASF20_13295 [Methylobacterium sp. Leaf88]
MPRGQEGVDRKPRIRSSGKVGHVAERAFGEASEIGSESALHCVWVLFHEVDDRDLKRDSFL